MLKVEHIHFSYGRRKVLQDVTFDVAPGEITALAGANGAGKTTLLRILSFVLMQDSGNVSLDDVDPLLLPVRYRRWIGYLSEKAPLYEEMTVEQYLIYRLKLRGERSSRLRRRLTGAVESCGLEAVAASAIRSLSKGFKKRVALADAMAQNPRLLLLDDPLPGLDAEGRRRIGAALTDFSAHSSVIVAGHEIDEMLNWCTRFVVLDEGRIAAVYRRTEHEREALKIILQEAVSRNHGGGAR
jgi:ABC-2 type transport system ATP-binding protein